MHANRNTRISSVETSNSQRTCICNSTTLKLTQQRYKFQKLWPCCTNKHAKEKEKNRIILAIINIIS